MRREKRKHNDHEPPNNLPRIAHLVEARSCQSLTCRVRDSWETKVVHLKTIFRSKHAEDYTILPNALIRDSGLSFRSRGVLAMCLSSREDWVVTNQWLRDQGTEGREAVAASLKELEATGYARFERVNGDKGVFVSQVWTFYDTPLPMDKRTRVGEPTVIRQAVARDSTVIRQAVGTALPWDGKPAAKKNCIKSKKNKKEEELYADAPVFELGIDDSKPPKAAKSKTSALSSIPESEVVTECLRQGLTKQDGEWLFAKWTANDWTSNGRKIKKWKLTITCWIKFGTIFPSQRAKAEAERREADAQKRKEEREERKPVFYN